jgi:serine/threonine-protein kinase RsbW
LEVPGTLEYRALVTRTVAVACRVASADATTDLDEYVNELVSAVGEAFNNVVVHGYAERGSGPICIVVEGSEDGVGIELRDFGESFDPNEVEMPETLEPSESGMGLFILRSFVDRLEYSAGSPNSLSLFKQFPWVRPGSFR